MSSNIKQVGTASGLGAFIIVFVFIQVVFVGLLEFAGYGTWYQRLVINADWLWVPLEAMQLMRDNPGTASTAIAAILMSANAAAYSAAAMALAYWGYVWARPRQATRRDTGSLAVIESGDSRDVVEWKPDAVQFVMKPRGCGTLSGFMPSVAANIPRAKLKTNRPPKTALEKFELGLHEILVAHKNWSADPSGNHAKVGLLEHTKAVTEKMIAELPDEPLARSIGLAHDIGKILAYKPVKKNRGEGKTEIIWKRVAKNHSSLSAHIVRLMPEFQALEPAQRLSINMVLSYQHDEYRLPKSAADATTRRLLQKIRLCDGIATRDDKLTAVNNAGEDGTVQAISEQIPKIVPGLNVNCRLNADDDADGWTNTALDYVAIQADALKRNLKGMLPQEIENAISLHAQLPKNKEDPAFKALYLALKANDLIYEDYDGRDPKNALFWIRSGRYPFSNIFLMKRDRMEEVFPEWTKNLGDWHFPLKLVDAKAPEKAANARSRKGKATPPVDF